MDTSVEWKIVVGQRRFTSAHRTVEEEDLNNNGGTKWRTSWEPETWKKIEILKNIVERKKFLTYRRNFLWGQTETFICF